jgi:hypothetical protein
MGRDFGLLQKWNADKTAPRLLAGTACSAELTAGRESVVEEKDGGGGWIHGTKYTNGVDALCLTRS